MMNSPHNLLLLAGGFLVGVVVHLALFIRGEWHLHVRHIIWAHISLLGFCYAIKWRCSTTEFDAAQALPLAFYTYLVGLYTSIGVYRSFLHPLRKFPGPWYARVSKLWHLWPVRDAKNHLVLDNLYQRYGDFVRTGPSELTVFHPDIYAILDGPRTQCERSDWYDLMAPIKALAVTRDKALHSARRRVWANGMTTSATAVHNKKFQGHIAKMEKCIEEDVRAHVPTRISDVVHWFAFDAMGDLVFSKSFGMLDTRQWHEIVSKLKNGLYALGPLSPVAWLLNFGFLYAPRVSYLADWDSLNSWCRQTMEQRLRTKDPEREPDLAYYLLEKEDKVFKDDPKEWLQGDTLLAIMVGSEPIAGLLLSTFYFLAKHPEQADKVLAEIGDIDPADTSKLSQLPHLTGVINEAARHFPTVLTGNTRRTGRDGATVGGVYIPPYTNIVAPRYSIYRREDTFARPLEYIPERWSTQPELIHKPDTFSPFGRGTVSCPGRTLSMDVMRSVLARLVKKYRWRFVPGDAGERFVDGMVDCFTTSFGELDLCFERRTEG